MTSKTMQQLEAAAADAKAAMDEAERKFHDLKKAADTAWARFKGAEAQWRAAAQAVTVAKKRSS